MKQAKKIVSCMLSGAVFAQTMAITAFAQGGQLVIHEDHVQSSGEETLILEQYKVQSTGKLGVSNAWELETYVYTITPETEITVDTVTGETWVYVEYLTDLNTNGVYEWTGVNYWDGLTAEGTLIPASAMTNGIFDSITFNAMTLIEGALQAEQLYIPGAQSEMEGMTYAPVRNHIISVSVSQKPVHLSYGSAQPSDLTTYYFYVDYRGWEDVTQVGAPAFSDLAVTDWYWNAVNAAVKRGLFSGMENNQFRPEVALKRSMAIQVLYGQSSLKEHLSGNFSDVDSNEWYANAMSWAAYYNILDVEAGDTLRPDEDITREELAECLYRYAQMSYEIPTMYGDLSRFVDIEEITNTEVMLWATNFGIMDGTPEGELQPQEGANRAAASTMMMQFFSNTLPTLENPPVPEIDEATGGIIDPYTGLLIDPSTGELFEVIQ